MNNEIVILLHGLANTPFFMKQIEKALSKEGYEVLNLGYPSRKYTLSELADYIYKKIEAYSNHKIHFVAYSMGCLIVRVLIAKQPQLSIGKVVMLAPPNQGSEVADFLKEFYWYRQFFGPAAQELTTFRAKENPFPPLKSPCGIIAGNICLDPISYFILPKGNDGKVTIASTKLDGMKDHIIVPTSHTFITFSKRVTKQILHFLKFEKFE